MKARVFVTLKNGVLDPQGEAIRHALGVEDTVLQGDEDAGFHGGGPFMLDCPRS